MITRREDKTRTTEEKTERRKNFIKLHNLDNAKYTFYDCVVGEIVQANNYTAFNENIINRLHEHNDNGEDIKGFTTETDENRNKLVFFRR